MSGYVAACIRIGLRSIDDVQDCHFVPNRMDKLPDLAHLDLFEAYGRLRRKDVMEAGPRPEDRIMMRDIGHWNATRRAGALHAI